MTDSSDTSSDSIGHTHTPLNAWFNDLPDSIQHALITIPSSSDYVIALSGGLDSSVLLALVHKYVNEYRRADVRAIHVHHGLSESADDWQLHCESLCQRLGVSLVVERVVIESDKKGVEAAARKARYEAFDSHLGRGALLLQGHHQNDQAETVLLRLMRGAGVAGVAGIPKTRSLPNGRLYRPLLSIPRSTLLHVAQSMGLEWVEDESNANVDFDRNFIRHEILPRLESRWSGAVRRLSTTSDHCRESLELENALAEIDLAAVQSVGAAQGSAGMLVIEALTRLSLSRQANVVRYWLRQHRMGFPGERKFHRIWSELIAARDDAQPEIEWAAGAMRRYKGKLFLIARSEIEAQDNIDVTTAVTVDYSLNNHGASVPFFDKVLGGFQYRLVHGGSESTLVRKPSEGELITIRFRQGGEQFMAAGHKHHRPLKKWLHDYNVPPWLRDSIPLLYYNESLVAVGDVLVAEGFQVDVGTEGIGIRCRCSCEGV